MSTPGSPPPRPGGSHRAAPASGGVEAAPGSPLLLPVLSVLVVLGAIGLAAWMLLTAGTARRRPIPRPSPSRRASPAASPATPRPASPTDDGDKKDDDKSDQERRRQERRRQDRHQERRRLAAGAADPGVRVQPDDDLRAGRRDGVGSGVRRLERASASTTGSATCRPTPCTSTPVTARPPSGSSKDFPDFGRVWPASAPMPAGALTVILADTARK